MLNNAQFSAWETKKIRHHVPFSRILVGTTHKLRERLIQLQAAQTRGAERAIPEGASSHRAARQ